MWRKLNFAHLGYVFLVNIGIKWLIDTPINTILMTEYGYKISLITTTFIYIIIGIVSVKLYDHYKGGPLSFLEDIKNKEQSKLKLTILGYVIYFFKMLILGLILSLKNAGLVVIVFRSGSHLYNGFPGTIIKVIFLGYLLFINIVWNIIIYYFSPTLVIMWDMLKHFIKYIILFNFKIYI